jgi:hypothetical protein
VVHVHRFPLAAGLGLLFVLIAGCFGVFVARMPREARLLVRRTLRTRRVAQALGIAVGGVAVAFGIVASVPVNEVPQMLPVAVIITVAARIAAFASLRATLGTSR